jgi:hypothetical protein
MLVMSYCATGQSPERAVVSMEEEEEEEEEEECLTVRNLSIKLYHIYVCYTNITLYIAFGIIRSFR